MKKVAKHENKFAKLQSQAAKYQFRNQLKTVKKQEYTLKEPEEDVSKKPLVYRFNIETFFTSNLIYNLR